MYRKPRPVLANPHSRYADQYCAFHDTTGHRTEACISLRLLIERFIENGKLVHFLADQRVRQDPEHGNRPHQNRFHQNQNNPRDERGRNQERGREPERRPDLRAAQERSRSLARPARQENLPEIQTISGGFGGGEESSSARKAYARSAFKQMKTDRSKVIPARHSLVGFTGEQVLPLGSIELPVTAGMYPRQRTVMVRFLIVDRSSAYNAILGRTTLNEFKAVTSTPHLSMKFPTEEGVGVEKGDHRIARECYNTSLKKLPEATRLGEKKKDEEK
ncbi:uncharacterized protein LOC133873417 [Alnus glutinosa]|uniref:uncharacterized protein LOC133873417 n=1 Tax=Alnus glutinosa TaxID=3517 RepID=UPI002D79EC20|nr:uncharacterized protein LOC133873417 [Alnus glutinosa]